MKKSIVTLALCLLICVCVEAQTQLEVPVLGVTAEKAIVPTLPPSIEQVKPELSPNQPIAFSSSNLGTNIAYHDGPVMEANHNIYFVWYGNWNGNTATNILPQFMTDLNGSAYMNIDNTYFDDSRKASSNIFMSDQIFDNYSQGAALSDAGVANAVSRALTSGGLPTDTNGMYYVLTSADVNETSGFCTSYCGWHTHATINGTDIKYAFVGNPDRCPSACEAQATGPNNNAGADGMANVMSHELNETVTDPDLNGWFRGNTAGEVGDLCNFNFGNTFLAPNGALANVDLNGRDYLIQQLYINSGGGGCAMSYQPLTGLCYQAHVENIGWMAPVCDGDVAGTVHQSLRMEAIKITAPPGHSVCYQAHVQNIGWMAPVCDGAIAGTTGQSLRMEALKVWFQSGGGHVEYFGQVQNLFWTGPVQDEAQIGTTGQSLRLEAVVIRAFP